jgi:hypothetical protein
MAREAPLCMYEGVKTKFEVLVEKSVHTIPNILSSGLFQVLYLVFQVYLAKDLLASFTCNNKMCEIYGNLYFY